MVASLVGVALALVAPAVSAPSATVVNVTAGKPCELRFTFSKKTVAKGKVTFKLVNKGVLEHDLKIGGKKTPWLKTGKSATLNVTLKAGKVAVPLHRGGARRRRDEGHPHRQVGIVAGRPVGSAAPDVMRSRYSRAMSGVATWTIPTLADVLDARRAIAGHLRTAAAPVPGLSELVGAESS